MKQALRILFSCFFTGCSEDQNLKKKKLILNLKLYSLNFK